MTYQLCNLVLLLYPTTNSYLKSIDYISVDPHFSLITNF